MKNIWQILPCFPYIDSALPKDFLMGPNMKYIRLYINKQNASENDIVT